MRGDRPALGRARPSVGHISSLWRVITVTDGEKIAGIDDLVDGERLSRLDLTVLDD